MRVLEATLDMYEWWRDKKEGKILPEHVRSPHWRDVRKNHLTYYSECACCGGTDNLEVHHIVPFSIAPTLELDPENLLTLCSSKKYGVHCHLLIGHCGWYRDWNPFSVLEAKLWNIRLTKRDQLDDALLRTLNHLESIDFESSALYQKIREYEHHRLCW